MCGFIIRHPMPYVICSVVIFMCLSTLLWHLLPCLFSTWEFLTQKIGIYVFFFFMLESYLVEKCFGQTLNAKIVADLVFKCVTAAWIKFPLFSLFVFVFQKRFRKKLKFFNFFLYFKLIFFFGIFRSFWCAVIINDF